MAISWMGLLAWVFRTKLLEAWYIHKLENGYMEERAAAALELGSLGSVKSVPKLLSALRKNCDGGGTLEYTVESQAYLEAFRRLGRLAAPFLVNELARDLASRERQAGAVTAPFLALLQVYPAGPWVEGDASYIDPLLKHLAESNSEAEEVTKLAAEALAARGKD